MNKFSPSSILTIPSVQAIKNIQKMSYCEIITGHVQLPGKEKKQNAYLLQPSEGRYFPCTFMCKTPRDLRGEGTLCFRAILKNGEVSRCEIPVKEVIRLVNSDGSYDGFISKSEKVYIPLVGATFIGPPEKVVRFGSFVEKKF